MINKIEHAASKVELEDAVILSLSPASKLIGLSNTNVESSGTIKVFPICIYVVPPSIVISIDAFAGEVPSILEIYKACIIATLPVADGQVYNTVPVDVIAEPAFLNVFICYYPNAIAMAMESSVLVIFIVSASTLVTVVLPDPVILIISVEPVEGSKSIPAPSVCVDTL